MEETGSPRLYNTHAAGRLSDSLLGETPFNSSVQNFKSFLYKKIQRDDCSYEQSCGSRCNRKSGSTVNTEFYFGRFSSTKEGNWKTILPPSFQPENAKQIYFSKKVSVNKYVQSPRFPPTSRLDDESRPDKCLLSSSGGPRSSTFPSYFICRNDLANDVSPVWPSNRSESFCQPHQLDRADSKGPRHSIDSLPRRFFDSFPIKTSVSKTYGPGDQDTSESWLGGKLRKVDCDTPTINRIPWHRLGPLAERETSSRRQIILFKKQTTTSAEPKEMVTQKCSEFVRHFELRKFHCTKRSSEFPCLSTILQPVIKVTGVQGGLSPAECPTEPSVVESTLLEGVASSSSTPHVLSVNRCVGFRMGCAAQHSHSIGYVDTSRESSSQQLSRNVGNITSDRAGRVCDAEFMSFNSERQPNRGGLSSQRRRNSFGIPSNSCIRGTKRSRSLPHCFDGVSHSRSLQLRSRSSVASQSLFRVASCSQIHLAGIRAMGNSRDRSFCFRESSCNRKVRFDRPERPEGGVLQRILSPVALRTSMGVSTSMPDPPSPDSPEPSDGHFYHGCSSLGKSILAPRPSSQSLGPTCSDKQPRAGLSGHHDKSRSSAGRSDEFGSVADTGWSTLLESWGKDQINILDKSWRKSTLATYKPAWLRWCMWCRDQNIDIHNPLPADLARFLTDLCLKYDLSYNSICLHKSVVSTFCRPSSGNPLSSHIIVRQTLKGIALQKPQKRKAPIWDINILTNYLSSNAPKKATLFEISKRIAVILLLCSGRRVHDLTLLRIDESSCIFEENSVVLWPEFGSKTDTASYRQSGWRLLQCQSNRNIDPVYWLKALIECSNVRRGDIKSLFISTCGAVKPATRSIIGGWVRSALREAGVRASAGSVRAAVASASWIDNTPVDEILARGNWQSATTFHKFYRREVDFNHTRNHILSLFQSI